MKCILHPDNRKAHPEFDQWELPTCLKHNLASLVEVVEHMINRHKREWVIIHGNITSVEVEE